MLWLTLSSIALWIIVVIGVLLLAALLRVVARLDTSMEYANRRRISVGQQIPSMTALQLFNDGSSAPADASIFANRHLLFLSPGCERCDRAIDWTLRSPADWVFLIAAKESETRVATRLWGIEGRSVLCEVGISFQQQFDLPILPFAMSVDADSVVVAASPVSSAADLGVVMHGHDGTLANVVNVSEVTAT